MENEVIGREGELARLAGFLDGREAQTPRGLALAGEAGIGKSTLWLRGLEVARERGWRVLSSRPAEAERNFALAGLGDLFDGALDEVLPALPPPRRRALEVALLLEEAESPLAPRALGVAVRSALELLAADQPLLVAVDDVQWLDPSSTDALAFALRRTAAPMRLLLARRVGTASDSRLESALPASSVECLDIGPLTLGALQALLRDRLDRVFPRPTLLRIHQTSGGNPFYALELARAFPDDIEPSAPLPMPETLDGLLRARLDALPESSRPALVLLSALGEAEAETLRLAGAEEGLEPALAHEVVVQATDRVRFAHPLIASTVYQGADESTRRASHAALARIVLDPLERARHLALSADGPDAALAAALDEAATGANTRGVPDVAAELGELARQLTPTDDRAGRHRRAIITGTLHLRSGDVQRARVLAEETAAEATDPNSHAEALVLTSAVEAAAGDASRALELRREALAEADSHPALQAAVHQWLAANTSSSEGLAVKERHAREALDSAERAGDNALRAGALAVLAWVRLQAGEPDAAELAEEAHGLATSNAADDTGNAPRELAHVLAWTWDRLDLVPSFTLADVLMASRRFDEARALLGELAQLGDEPLAAKALWLLSIVEVEAGRWSLASELAERARDVVSLYQTGEWPGPYLVLAELALHHGDVEGARELATRARDLPRARSWSWDAEVDTILGLASRADGDLGAAVDHFAAADATARMAGRVDPDDLWWRPDYVETLLELGRVDDAVELLDATEPDAKRLRRDHVFAQLMRCRGLVAAARGELQVALAILEQAVDQVDVETDPFGHARALLALGVTRRRARQKRGAREAIEAALAGFEALGEVPWRKRARAELGRIGGRTREEGLTPAERRVAALVADGRTNREVAAALSLGERTVETHLTHIYAKLGVRTRTELARVYEPAS